MHVDGFRFDLAASAGPRAARGRPAVGVLRPRSSRTRSCRQVKLIAEPWDVGEGGYQVGNFPPLWSEWNGQYRDTVRDFWRGDAGHARPSSRYRLTGSSDLYQADGRRPVASINFVTAHDGFTLARPRLLQRQAQRGQRRGQPRRREPQPLLELRRRRADRRPGGHRAARAASSATSSRRCCCRRACRCCSAATRSGRTQRGNNNAYCQDNEISWFDWAARRRGPARRSPAG